jgi:hypothetical protein
VRGNCRARGGIDKLAIGQLDQDLFGSAVGQQPPLLQGTDDGVGLRVAAGCQRADCRFGIGERIVGELRERVLERSGQQRQRRGERNQRREHERAKRMGELHQQWVAPTMEEGGGHRRLPILG